jgi:metal-responsive CopG/Arc/MetJ family transcriptional regulator
MNSQKAILVRASISFPPDLYETLEEIAKQKKVSLAWVVREASERYAVDETGKSANGRKRTGRRTVKLMRRSTWLASKIASQS